MTQYLQGSSKSAQTWRLHGLLVQAAFQLGVHSEDTQNKFSVIEKEIRRRTWYTCVVLDRYLLSNLVDYMPTVDEDYRTLSLTFGRPPLIHNEFIQIDLPIDVELDDLLDEDERSPRPPDHNFRPSSCGLFIASMYGPAIHAAYLLLKSSLEICIAFKVTLSATSIIKTFHPRARFAATRCLVGS